MEHYVGMRRRRCRREVGPRTDSREQQPPARRFERRHRDALDWRNVLERRVAGSQKAPKLRAGLTPRARGAAAPQASAQHVKMMVRSRSSSAASARRAVGRPLLPHAPLILLIPLSPAREEMAHERERSSSLSTSPSRRSRRRHRSVRTAIRVAVGRTRRTRSARAWHTGTNAHTETQRRRNTHGTPVTRCWVDTARDRDAMHLHRSDRMTHLCEKRISTARSAMSIILRVVLGARPLPTTACPAGGITPSMTPRASR